MSPALACKGSALVALCAAPVGASCEGQAGGAGRLGAAVQVVGEGGRLGPDIAAAEPRAAGARCCSTAIVPPHLHPKRFEITKTMHLLFLFRPHSEY